jgi:quinol-cytochrome oxidoreductase complex cytochrome b subunit
MIFLLLMALSAVPGGSPDEKLTAMGIGAICVAVSIWMGLWGIKDGEPAIAASRLNSVLGVLLLVQFAWAVASIVAVLARVRF